MGKAPLARARPDSAKAVHAARIGRGAPPAEEIVRIVAAATVGLPDLDHQVVERPAVELRDASCDLDRLAGRTLAADHGEVARALRELAREERPERHLAGGYQLHGRRAVAALPRTTS